MNIELKTVQLLLIDKNPLNKNSDFFSQTSQFTTRIELYIIDFNQAFQYNYFLSMPTNIFDGHILAIVYYKMHHYKR